MSVKCLLVCIDGASFNFIDLFSQGKLPIIHSLMDKGNHSYLNSTFPPMSCPAWVSMYTGQNPGKLGFMSFYRKVQNSYEVELANYKVQAPSIWELLSASGKKVGVVNLHLTSPPDCVNGIMASPVYDDTGQYCYPTTFQEKIEKDLGRLDYEVKDLASFLKDPLQKHLELEENRYKLAEYVYQHGDYDFFACGFNIDRINHRIVDSREVETFYKKADDILGRLLKLIRPENVFVVSDHGMGPLKGIFSTNEWLISLGFMQRSNKVTKNYLVNKLDRIRKSILRLHWLKHVMKEIIPNSIQKKILRYKKARLFAQINWSHTKAFSPFANAIYINLVGREPNGSVKRSERANLAREIIDELHKLPSTEAYLREEIYEGEYISEFPDVVFWMDDCKTECEFPGEIFSSLSKEDHQWTHRQNGVFIAAGTDIKVNGDRAKFDLTDISPTILHLMKETIPVSNDGRVLDIFTPESDPGRREPLFGKRGKEFKLKSSPDEEEVEKRLRALGYID